MSKIKYDPNSDIGKIITKYDDLSKQRELSSKELEVIKMYTEASDMFLYTSMCNIKEQDRERYKEFKRRYCGSRDMLSIGKLMTLNNVIHRYIVKDEIVLYRGTKKSDFDNVAIKDGNKVILIPPTSTTIIKKTAYDYTSTLEPLLLEIHLPAKYQALWLKPFSLYPTECEFLLASKSQFMVEDESEEYINDHIGKRIILKGILPNK